MKLPPSLCKGKIIALFQHFRKYSHRRGENFRLVQFSPLINLSLLTIDRIHEMRDVNQELPGHFLHELYKWALECTYLLCSTNKQI